MQKHVDIPHMLAKKPQLYVGERNLAKLKTFLDGYATCACANGLDYDEDRARAL